MTIRKFNQGPDNSTFTSEFMLFTRLKSNPKTERFMVTTLEESQMLGIIKWKSTWRRYNFFPEPNTDYDAQCHRDLAEFLDMLMQRYKEKRRLDKRRK